MESTPLSTQTDHHELEAITRRIAAGRYFRQLDEKVLEQMLRRGELVRCNPEEMIFQEGEEQAVRMGVLLEGSLAVTSQESFLMRLDQTGDVIGEMSVLRPGPHSAGVVAEVESLLVMFPNELFAAPEHSAEVSAIYLVFAHILVEKLRITTAQTRLQRGNRVSDAVQPPRIGVVDSNPEALEQLLALVQDVWPRGQVSEVSREKLLEGNLTQGFDLMLVDPLDGGLDTDVIPTIEASVLLSEMILAVSRYCMEEGNREQLANLGVTSFLSKPFSEFDCRHLLSQLRVAYYRQRELEQVEHAADTDRLTGLANRRKLDEFIEALATLYPERREPFSLIIADVDNFKHYNDTHGHQMGDVVLATVSSVFK
ncbi:MAG: diguanylate cyclase, partial [SAR324 cluster bacterium]|nr:diguanylate cyclase [SAR324 cluster bacterium]